VAPTAADARAALRRRLVAAREALPPAEHAAHSIALEAHLDRLVRRLAPSRLGFCWPYRGEFDCRPLIARLMAEGTRVALPVIGEADAPLAFRCWTAASPMIVGRHGIPVPADGASLLPEVVLVPVNAFDAKGFRLGYGGGYFDRTLAALTPRPVAVGIGFELARVDTISPQPFDLPMDYVVTEAGAYIRRAPGLIPLA
jgi:5,10-methenyltetrahydrofolate synthetase